MGFVPYQVDYSTQNTAKTLGFTKKKVSFKFGFANPQSLRSGATGAACRGSEHELVFLWSLKSGKRQLFLDGRDVHFSESGQNGWTVDRAWQHAFTMRDATGTYRVHFISQPKNPDLPDSRPFDMRVAGVSYFAFNRIFQLGTPTMTVRDNNRDGGSNPRHRSGRDSPMSPEERRQVAAAKVESLRDMQRPNKPSSRRSPSPEAPPKLPRDEPNLLSFDDPPPPALPGPGPAVMAGSTGSYNQFASSITLDASFATSAAAPSQHAPNPYGPPGPYGQPPPPPPAPYGSGYETQPSYGQSASMTQLPYGQTPAPQPFQQQPQSSYSSYGSSFPGMAPAPAPYSDPSSSSLALAPYQAPTISTEPAPSPYALPLSTPTSSYTSNYQQQPPQQQPPSFASPGGQSYASYGSAPSFAQPPPAQQQQPAPYSTGGATTSSPPSAYGDMGGYSYSVPSQQQTPAPMPMQSYGGAPPAVATGSFYTSSPPAPASTPFGDSTAYYTSSASMQQPMPPQQPPQPYGSGGYQQQYPSY